MAGRSSKALAKVELLYREWQDLIIKFGHTAPVTMQAEATYRRAYDAYWEPRTVRR